MRSSQQQGVSCWQSCWPSDRRRWRRNCLHRAYIAAERTRKKELHGGDDRRRGIGLPERRLRRLGARLLLRPHLVCVSRTEVSLIHRDRLDVAIAGTLQRASVRSELKVGFVIFIGTIYLLSRTAELAGSSQVEISVAGKPPRRTRLQVDLSVFSSVYVKLCQDFLRLHANCHENVTPFSFLFQEIWHGSDRENLLRHENAPRQGRAILLIPAPRTTPVP